MHIYLQLLYLLLGLTLDYYVMSFFFSLVTVIFHKVYFLIQVLLYSIWNSSHCYVAAWMGEGFGGELFFVQSLSHVRLFATLWTTAHQAFLSFTISRILLRLMPIELVVSSNHLILLSPSPAFNLSQHQGLS